MIDCPICKGSGQLDSPKVLGEVGEKRYFAKLLREHGFSMRQIMRMLGYKSPAAVQFLLKDENGKVVRTKNRRRISRP